MKCCTRVSVWLVVQGCCRNMTVQPGGLHDDPKGSQEKHPTPRYQLTCFKLIRSPKIHINVRYDTVTWGYVIPTEQVQLCSPSVLWRTALLQSVTCFISFHTFTLRCPFLASGLSLYLFLVGSSEFLLIPEIKVISFLLGRWLIS